MLLHAVDGHVRQDQSDSHMATQCLTFNSSIDQTCRTRCWAINFCLLKIVRARRHIPKLPHFFPNYLD